LDQAKAMSRKKTWQLSKATPPIFMPITKSAKKALRSSKRKRIVNLKIKKNTRQSVSAFTKKPTAGNLKKAISAIDKAVKKKIMPANTANRQKSKLSKLLKNKKS